MTTSLLLVRDDPDEPAGLARAVDSGLPIVTTRELGHSRLLLTDDAMADIAAAARRGRERGARGLCLSFIEASRDAWLENAWPALAWGAELCGPSPDASPQALYEKLSRIWWGVEAAGVVQAMARPPAMNLGAGRQGQAALEALLRARPTETWLWMRRGENYGVAVAEARRVFGQTHRLLRDVERLQAGGRARDAHLRQAELLLRLHRHVAMKVLALDNARSEYRAALRTVGARAGAGPMPPETLRHLEAAQTHCRALLHDYPYFQEAFRAAQEQAGLRPADVVWAAEGAEDAARFHQRVTEALEQARQGTPPPSETEMGWGRPEAPEMVGRWPVSAIDGALARQPRTLKAEAALPPSPGGERYLVWEMVGEATGRLEEVSLFAVGPKGQDIPIRTLKQAGELTASAPRILRFRLADEARAAQRVRIEGRFSGACGAPLGEIRASIGAISDEPGE